MRLIRSLLAAFLLLTLGGAPAALAAQATYAMPTTGPLSFGDFVNLKLNPALSAIISSNSGATAPAVSGQPGAYQTWMDTSGTPRVLRIYDGTNWAPIGLLDPTAHTWIGTGNGLSLIGSTSGTVLLKAPAVASGTITLPFGTTDFSATGGTGQAVKQLTVGGPFTVGQLACTDLSDTATKCLNTISANALLGNPTGSTALPQAMALTSCSTASSALTYNTTSHAFGCNSISGGGGSSATDIRTYGAVCGGSGVPATNASAITQAISAAGAAFIPACTINVSPVTLSSGANVFGTGFASILNASGTLTKGGLLRCASCNGLTVTGITITTTAAQRTSPAVSGVVCTTCTHVTIADNTIAGNYGIRCSNCTFVEVSGNTITGYGEASGSNADGNAISLDGPSNDADGYPCSGSNGTYASIHDNNITGAATGSVTPIGINVCTFNQASIANNKMLSPGYFGVSVRGSVNLITITNNSISNSQHEAILVAGEVNSSNNTVSVAVEGNTLTYGATSIDFGMTIDGTLSGNGTRHNNVDGNTLKNCFNSCIVLASGNGASTGVLYGRVSNNLIFNAVTNSVSAQAGIVVDGPHTQFNIIIGNSVVSASSKPSTWAILESGGASHNFFSNNAQTNMQGFSFTGSSNAVNNINY